MIRKELPTGRQYRYYVHPEDTPTNDFLAPRLEEAGDKECSDGKERFMFTTRDHNDIAYIQRSRLDKNLKFLFYPFSATERRRDQNYFVVKELADADRRTVWVRSIHPAGRSLPQDLL